MSAEAVETVLTRAMSDADFAESLFTNAEEALAGYDLTKEEVEGFKNMSREGFNEFAKISPEERKSMVGIPKGPAPKGPLGG
jgi:hypothetical protein